MVHRSQMLITEGSIIKLVGPFFLSIYIRMPTINYSVTQSIDTLAVNLSASEALVMNINNPLIGASYFGLETIPDSNGVYTSASPKNTSGSFTLGTGVLGVVKDDYKMGAVVSPGSNVLTFVPAQAVTGSTLRTRGVAAPPPSTGFDADAEAFFARVTAAGGALTSTEQTAVNQLVLDMKSAGIWSAMKAVYPMVGASAAACAQNLKSSSFTSTFTSGWTFASTGVTPNGTSAYCDTNVILQTTIFGKDYSFGYYSRTNNDGTAGDIGNFYTTGVSVNALSTYTRLANEFYLDSPNEAVRTVVANANSLGFYASNNSPSVGRNLYKNNTKIINTAFSNNDFPVQPNPNVAFGASYIGNVGGTRFSSRQLAFVYFGSALLDIQTSNFYTAVQAFQTTLNRQV